MNSAGDLTISRNLSTSPLPSVREDESRYILLPTDVDHSDEIEDQLDLEPDLKVNLFMANDTHVSDLHPGSKAPEKGFLERHKVLGVFLIGASAILTVGVLVGGIAGFIVGITALAGTPGGAILAAFSPFVFMGLAPILMALGSLTVMLVNKTFKEHFRTGDATDNLSRKLRQSLEPQEARARTRAAKEIFKGLATVKTTTYDSSRSVAEVDFLVKYSQLPEDLKRDLLARFFKERTKGTEAPATLLQSEEREFESTQKLYSGGLLDTLSTRLRIDRADIHPKESNESWEDYYKDIFSIVKENKYYQALPQERRDAIEALSTHPATQLFHAAQDLQAVEEAITNGVTTTFQQQNVKTLQAPQDEQIASGTVTMQQWLDSELVQIAIKNRMNELAKSRVYVPIIQRTPLPAH
jgi:hypothetical protein